MNNFSIKKTVALITTFAICISCVTAGAAPFAEKIFPQQQIEMSFAPFSVYAIKDTDNVFANYELLNHQVLKRDIFVNELYFGHSAQVGMRSNMVYTPFNSKGEVTFNIDRPKDAPEDMAVCFTVPKAGNYNIDFSCYNAGAGLGGGDGGGAIISHMTAAATVDDNFLSGTTPLAIPNGETPTPVTFNNNIEAAQGDKIILRLDPNVDGWNDQFKVKYVITNNAENGEVYDLHNAAPSTMGNYSFYYMNRTETNTDNYGRTFPVSQSEPYASWRGQLGLRPFIFWRDNVDAMNAQDAGYHFKMETESDGDGAGCLGVGWTAPKDGKYSVDLEMLNKGRDTTGGEGVYVKVFKLAKGENMEPKTNVIDEFHVAGSPSEVYVKNGVVNLQKGDRLMIKAKSQLNSWGVSIFTKFNVTEIPDFFISEIKLSDTAITSVSQLAEGNELTARATINNYEGMDISGRYFVCMYDNTNTVKSIKMSVLQNFTNNNVTTVDLTGLIVPKNVTKIKAFLWDANCEIIKPNITIN